jgi:hypothetical protein
MPGVHVPQHAFLPQVKDPKTGAYYDQRAFFLGNTLRVVAQAFVIVQVDDFSLRYMQVSSILTPAPNAHTAGTTAQHAVCRSIRTSSHTSIRSSWCPSSRGRISASARQTPTGRARCRARSSARW